MTAMNMGLVTTLQKETSGGVPARKETDASSTVPGEDNDSNLQASSSHSRGHTRQTSELSSRGSSRGSAPPSPSSEKQLNTSGTTATSTKPQVPSRHPPGLGGPQHQLQQNLPSPIVKPGHSKNSSATSPLLTLTPNSSVDGNSEQWGAAGTGAGRHPSPCPSASAAETGAAISSGASVTTAPPSMPYLSTDTNRRLQQPGDAGANIETSSFGSFDQLGSGGGETSGSDNDGLLGLEALRERAARSSSSAAASAASASYSTSPPVSRGYLSPYEDQQQQQQQRHSSRSRPPLSAHSAYGAQEGSTSSFAGDARSVGDRSTGSLGLPSYQQQQQHAPPNNVSLDSGDGTGGRMPGFGAIGRPELRQAASDFDPSRRRSFSSDNFQQQQYQHDPSGQLSQKFGAMTTLGSHLQHQRGHGPQDGYGEVQKPRHIRSASQPMQGQHSALGGLHMDPRSAGGSSSSGGQYDASYGKPSGGQLYRGTSGSSHQGFSGSSYENSSQAQQLQYGHQKRASLPNYTGNPYSMGHSTLQRPDALDFQLSHNDQQRHAGTNLSGEDSRIFGGGGGGGSSMISPGQSPLQTHYGASHSRNPSDTPSAGILSSSPMSMGSGMLRNHGQPPTHMHHASMAGGLDDGDALIGENIEVPADHFGASSQGYGLNTSASMPSMRAAPHHAHSVSFDQLPALYHDSHHHLPTAGSALPLPKVVYIVKFKQTQRNFVLGPRITRDLKIGTYVKVEADRGEDLGIVVGRVPADKYNFASRNQYTAGMGPPGGSLGGVADLKRIIRLATHDEVSLLGMKREEEEELLKICRSKVRQRGLPMNVVDAEYQFDRHKLTFFFEAEGRVDFRELVRDLFSMYKTRIWMQQLDKNTSSITPAIVAPQAANLQMDYGTPIIAPPSEFADSVVLNGMGDPM